MSRVLVVDDDRFLLESVRKVLEREGYAVEAVPTAEGALASMARSQSDLVVLDYGLPGIDGMTTFRHLRSRWQTPVVMLIPKGDSVSGARALELGANSYLTKPFDSRQLLDRVRSHLNSESDLGATREPSGPIQVGDLIIDLERRDVFVGGKPVDLTNREFDVVAYLSKNLNRAISRDQLFESVWGYTLDFNSNSLDVYIYRIRRLIEDNPARPKYLQTMRGYGYKMVNPAQA